MPLSCGSFPAFSLLGRNWLAFCFLLIIVLSLKFMLMETHSVYCFPGFFHSASDWDSSMLLSSSVIHSLLVLDSGSVCGVGVKKDFLNLHASLCVCGGKMGKVDNLKIRTWLWGEHPGEQFLWNLSIRYGWILLITESIQTCVHSSDSAIANVISKWAGKAFYHDYQAIEYSATSYWIP